MIKNDQSHTKSENIKLRFTCKVFGAGTGKDGFKNANVTG